MALFSLLPSPLFWEQAWICLKLFYLESWKNYIKIAVHVEPYEGPGPLVFFSAPLPTLRK